MLNNKIVRFIIGIVIGIIIGFLIGSVILGCNTNSKRMYSQPRDCDDMDRFVNMTSKLTGIFSKENTSAAVALNLVTLSWAECRKARNEADKKEIFDKCFLMIYGNKPEPKKENYKKYADFADCRENK